MARTIGTYGEFWPFYLAEHSKPATRALHYIGTIALIAVAVCALWSGTWWALILALPVLYLFAWTAHFTIEHNKPATFTYPVWPLVSDFQMFALAATGGIAGELEKYQIRPRT